MMDDKFTIGLDYGTLSARAILVRCRDGKIMSEATKAYTHGVIEGELPEDTTGDGETDKALGANWCLEYPQDYIEALECIVPTVLKESGVDKTAIIGIGIDFTSCTMLPIDENAKPLCEYPAYAGRRNAYAKLWKHHGAQIETEKINHMLETEHGLEKERFGGKVSSELMIPKIMETLREDEEIYRAADEILEAGDWLTRILTNEKSRSCSMAGYKMWWNEENGYPDADFFQKLDSRLQNVIREKMPGKISSMGSRIGGLCAEWAERLGLAPGTPVAPTIIDSHAGFPGSGVSEPSQVMLVLGTSSVLLALSETAFSGQGVMGGVRDGIVPGYYAYESGLASVGDLYAWFAQHCVPTSYTEEAEQRGISIYTLLSEKAARLDAGESGLLALEWWNGNKTPYVDGTLSGCVIGMDLQTKPEEIFRALVEATAFGTRRILQLYEQNGVRAKEIIVSGGIASKNPLVLQIYADILNRPLRLAASAQAAALGAAIYASLAAGCEKGGYDDYETAVKCMTRSTDQIYQPDRKRHFTYDKMYALYCEFGDIMGKKACGILHELNKIKLGTRN